MSTLMPCRVQLEKERRANSSWQTLSCLSSMNIRTPVEQKQLASYIEPLPRTLSSSSDFSTLWKLDLLRQVISLSPSLSLSLSLSLFLLHCSFCANALSAAELIEATLAKRVEGHVGKATLVVATVTDNGSNYLKCSSNFSRDPWACVSHTCNLVFKALVDDTTEQLGADFDVLLVRC
jgi:hypothetical protein